VNTIYEVTEHEHFSGPNTPIIISNHVNWFDIYYYGGRMHPISFVAKAEISKNFVLRNLAAKMQVILLDRVSESSRSSTIEKIEARINDYNRDNYNYNPIVIFPEGTTSNGKSILRFKIGAFHNKSKITIVGFNYSCDGFGMGMDEFGPFEHLFISLCLKPKL
jgi:lysophosphatidylcholine acyltransferase/lyso-PAF acetyltransferase